MTCKYCSRPTKGNRVTCDVKECKTERARLACTKWYMTKGRAKRMRKTGDTRGKKGEIDGGN